MPLVFDPLTFSTESHFHLPKKCVGNVEPQWLLNFGKSILIFVDSGFSTLLSLSLYLYGVIHGAADIGVTLLEFTASCYIQFCNIASQHALTHTSGNTQPRENGKISLNAQVSPEVLPH